MKASGPVFRACAVLVAAVSLACSKPTDCLMVVTVTASRPITGVKLLSVTLREATDAPTLGVDTLSFKAPAAGWTISSDPEGTKTLGIEISASAAPVTIALEARGDGDVSLGKVARRMSIQPKANYIW